MIPRIVEIALAQRALMSALGLVLLFGGLYAFHSLDVIAYPDPSPPMVEVAAVRWTIQQKFGLEFIRMPSGDQERLRRYVKTLQTTSH